MKRLIAYVSGDVQWVGYRDRVMDIATAVGLKGLISNLKDGRVKIIAEGNDEMLEWFEKAIDMKFSSIRVSSMDIEYAPATGEFEFFGKLVVRGEADSRLDAAAVLLKDLLESLNKNERESQQQDRPDSRRAG
jgi:acylphosphatase